MTTSYIQLPIVSPKIQVYLGSSLSWLAWKWLEKKSSKDRNWSLLNCSAVDFDWTNFWRRNQVRRGFQKGFSADSGFPDNKSWTVSLEYHQHCFAMGKKSSVSLLSLSTPREEASEPTRGRQARRSPLLTLEGFSRLASSVQVVIGWQEKVEANFSVDLTKNAFSSDELIDERKKLLAPQCQLKWLWLCFKLVTKNSPFLGRKGKTFSISTFLSQTFLPFVEGSRKTSD